MKVFVINLDRDKDRLAAVDRQLRALGVDYERVPAVYGGGLSRDEKRRAVNCFRWWCVRRVPPRDGEIGCALSHQKVYEALVKKGDSCCCVLEDDVVLDSRFKCVLEQVERQIDRNKPQVFLLSNHSDPQALGAHVEGYRSPESALFETRRTTHDTFTEGYVLNSLAARALLKQNCPLKTVADDWTRWAKIGAIELYHVFPTVCWQDKQSFPSSTILEDSRCNVAQMSLPRWLAHKMLRGIGKVIDKLLIWLTGA